MKWKEKVLDQFKCEILKNTEVKNYYSRLKIDGSKVGVHLAIFSEPFLSLLFEGQKTMESRFSINRVSPYGKVEQGDCVFVKKTGGQVCGFFIVGKTFYFSHADTKTRSTIRKNFGTQICDNAVDNFWKRREIAEYISLFEVGKVAKFSPFMIDKRDRTAWAVVKPSYSNSML